MKRNKFSLSHYKLLSMKMGQLVPLTWYEALPGDTIQQATTALIRCAPMVTPAMHPVHVRIHHFFVPLRVIWQGSGALGSSATGGFENYITGGPDGLDATLHPYIQFANNASVSTLDDHLGLPLNGHLGQTTNVSALPYRAYQFIWNEYFRDQDLQTAAVVSTADGADTTTSKTLQNVAWEKDYYTVARPWEAKGPSITIPLSGTAPIVGLAVADGTVAANATARDQVQGNTSLPRVQTTTGGLYMQTTSTGATGAGNQLVAGAFLSSTTGGADINALRRAFALQRFQEARAHYGSRYTEYLRYLGIRSSDARLQRPEYLGGGRSTIQFSEVLQTAPGGSGVATMFGHGVSAHRTNRYRRFFEEHGIVMSLMSVRPITMYTGNLQRKFLRGMTSAGGAGAPAGLLGTREDYFVRELQHIGQQQISALEVDGNGVGTTVFGWTDRYDEYRRIENTLAGQFRFVNHNWHFAREFAAPPVLNSTFVSCVPRTDAFADTTNDNLYVMAHHSIQARRMMSRTGAVGKVF